MGRSTEYGETTHRDRTISRRLFGAGLFGAAVWPGQTLANTAPQTPDPTQPDPAEDIRMVSNLLTRMAAATQVNGWGRHRFVLDTGAGRTAIARDLADRLELEPGPTVLVHGITSAELTPTVRIGRLGFGGRRFNDLVAPVFDRSKLDADGLLGLDVLSRFALEFDLSRRTIRLTPSGTDVIEVSTTFATPTRLRRDGASRARQGRFGQMILTSARADGIPVDVFVDSGAQYSIGNMALYRALSPAVSTGPLSSLIQVFGVTGQVIAARPGTVTQLDIQRQRLGPTNLLFADLHAFGALELIARPALLIGADILYRFHRVSLDFGRSRMGFSGLRRLATTRV